MPRLSLRGAEIKSTEVLVLSKRSIYLLFPAILLCVIFSGFDSLRLFLNMLVNIRKLNTCLSK